MSCCSQRERTPCYSLQVCGLIPTEQQLYLSQTEFTQALENETIFLSIVGFLEFTWLLKVGIVKHGRQHQATSVTDCPTAGVSSLQPTGRDLILSLCFTAPHPPPKKEITVPWPSHFLTSPYYYFLLHFRHSTLFSIFYKFFDSWLKRALFTSLWLQSYRIIKVGRALQDHLV